MTSVQTTVPHIIRYTSVTFASLSILGAIYVFISSMFDKRLRSFSFRMLLWMCIFDLILACATIAGPQGTMEEEAGIANEQGQNIIRQNIRIGNDFVASLPLTCKLQAGAIQFSILASLLWTLCFAIHLFRISAINVNPHHTHSYTSLFTYLFISITAPFCLTIYIFAQDIVGMKLLILLCFVFFFETRVEQIGISADFWCYLNNDYLEEYAPKLLYIEAAILIFILFFLYFAIKCHLKRFILNSSNEQMLNREELNNDNNEIKREMILINHSRVSFVRAISGGLSSYLIAPFIAFIPFLFNLMCTAIGLEWSQHVLSWYILSGLLLGCLHVGIYLCAISIVRYSWRVTCCSGPNVMEDVVIDYNVEKDNAKGNDMKMSLNESENKQKKKKDVVQKRDAKKEFVERTLQQSTRHYMELV